MLDLTISDAILLTCLVLILLSLGKYAPWALAGVMAYWLARDLVAVGVAEGRPQAAVVLAVTLVVVYLARQLHLRWPAVLYLLLVAEAWYLFAYRRMDPMVVFGMDGLASVLSSWWAALSGWFRSVVLGEGDARPFPVRVLDWLERIGNGIVEWIAGVVFKRK